MVKPISQAKACGYQTNIKKSRLPTARTGLICFAIGLPPAP